MKKALLAICILIIVLAAAFGGLVFAYTHSNDYKSDTFPEHYCINGIDCTGLTYDEAKAKLTKEWNHQTFRVVSDMKEEMASFTNFDCTYNLNESVENVKHDNLLLSALNHYSKARISVEMKMAVKTCGNKFKDKIYGLPCLKQTEDALASTDAYVDTSNDKFNIVKETYGTKIDKEKFFDDVMTHISAGSLTLEFNESNYYSDPKILSDNETLLAYQDFCRTKLTQKINYDLGTYSYTIPTEDLAKFYKTDGSGKINKDGITEYVAGMAKKYDNVGAKRTFKTLLGKKITISGGTEGWTIDQDGEIEQLTKDLKSGNDVDREPVFSHTGYGKYKQYVGKTYIDVDFTKQEVHVFIKGKDKFNCEVVTGDKSLGKSTPTGLWFIKNKLTDVTMRGTNADGTKYEVPAEYWMGVTPNGIGFHDSNWRTEFGGDIWKTNGSHGCINMPKWLVKDMFDIVEVGMPVVMHY